MPPKIEVVEGVAGSGKTRFAVELLEEKLRSGVHWQQIAFTSYSRAACAEAARRSAVIVGEDASRLQRDAFFCTLHALCLRATEIDRKAILDTESSDGKKFLQSACGAAPDRERGTLGERVGDALAAWDLHRSRLGLNVSDIAGILRHDRSRASYAPPLTPCRKSVTKDELRRISENVGDGRDGPISGLASHKNPVFSASKTLFSVLLSRIGECDENKTRADKFFGEGSQNVWNYVPDINPLYVEGEKLGTARPARPSRIGEVASPIESLNEKCRVFGNVGDTLEITEPFRSVIEAYEASKQIYGRLDFTDILLRFLGISVDSDLNMIATDAAPPVTNGVQVWLFDEAQDFSPLLACCAERISQASSEAIYLGDMHQSIFAWAGSCGAILGHYNEAARLEGTHTLLNQSFRNPSEVIHWGECVLSEDREYESRNPVSAAYEDGVIREGSASLVKCEDFLSYLPELACSDVLVLSRTWFTLLPVKERLDSLGVPWRSCQEKQSSRWECQAKIAYTIALRDLERGELISEQDWRRITDTLPQKLDGIELFVRGTKAKWKKAVCSPVVSKGIHQLHEWGATEAFIDFVLLGHWRREMPALLDSAIEKYGLSVVRKPRIRLGSVHSVKGLEARNVFCLSASTARASGEEADFNEEICLKYVAITRASKNYRLVVNVNDIARSKPQFWAAPRGYWEFDSEPPQGHFREPEAEKPKDDGYFGPVRSEDTGEDPEMDWEFGI